MTNIVWPCPRPVSTAGKGWQRAMQDNPDRARGADVVGGRVTHQGVATALDMDHSPVETLF